MRSELLVGLGESAPGIFRAGMCNARLPPARRVNFQLGNFSIKRSALTFAAELSFHTNNQQTINSHASQRAALPQRPGFLLPYKDSIRRISHRFVCDHSLLDERVFGATAFAGWAASAVRPEASHPRFPFHLFTLTRRLVLHQTLTDGRRPNGAAPTISTTTKCLPLCLSLCARRLTYFIGLVEEQNPGPRQPVLSTLLV